MNEEFEKWEQYNLDYPNETPGYSYHDVEHAWNAATEAAKPRWIPVGERLPKIEAVYPVLSKHWDTWITRRFEKGQWFTDIDDEITHWFELPELPK